MSDTILTLAVTILGFGMSVVIVYGLIQIARGIKFFIKEIL